MSTSQRQDDSVKKTDEPIYAPVDPLSPPIDPSINFAQPLPKDAEIKPQGKGITDFKENAKRLSRRHKRNDKKSTDILTIPTVAREEADPSAHPLEPTGEHSVFFAKDMNPMDTPPYGTPAPKPEIHEDQNAKYYTENKGANEGLGLIVGPAFSDQIIKANPSKTYRCTRNSVYQDQTLPGYADVNGRQGIYIDADSPEQAAERMKKLYPEDTDGFTVQAY